MTDPNKQPQKTDANKKREEVIRAAVTKKIRRPEANGEASIGLSPKHR